MSIDLHEQTAPAVTAKPAPRAEASLRDARKRQRRLALLCSAFEESDAALLVMDPDGRVVHLNQGLTRMLGYTLDAVRGQVARDFLVGAGTDMQALQALRVLSSRPGGHRAELVVYTDAGRPLWVAALVNPVFDRRGRLLHLAAVLTDITDTKLHEVLQHKVLAAVVREQPMLEVMTMVCEEIERIAPEVVVSVLAVDEQHRLRPIASPSMPPSYALAIDGIEIGPAVGSCGTAAWLGEAVLACDIATDARWAPYKHAVLPLGLAACWSTPIRGKHGKVLGTFAFYFRTPREPSALHHRLVEVSTQLCALLLEREQTREHLHQLSYYDSLTGLPNRAMLQAKGERALHDAQRTGTPLTLVYIDVDRFKQVNDSHGHTVGDSLLREVARRLQALARETDIVGRLASDEFVLVLPQCGAEQAGAVIERIVAALALPFAVQGVTLHPAASLGVAVYPDDGSDIETLLRHADMAMVQAKQQARGSFRFFSAEMNRAAQERVALEAALREALQEGGLALHYQPQVNGAAAHQMLGVEALLRWHHPVLGHVPPLRFVALAEECGLIRELGTWVLGRACRQMADWRTQGVAVPRVAVNLSASHFQDACLPELVERTLKFYGLKPEQLTLEMTESVMLHDDPAVMATLRNIHAMGVRLSMDDFGTGYSSLSYLHRLPIDELKLDKSFVRDLEHSEPARALTSSVLRLGEGLHVDVVAEGVETAPQQAFLAERGCAVLQGYLFAKPMPPEAMAGWLADLARREPLSPPA